MVFGKQKLVKKVNKEEEEVEEEQPGEEVKEPVDEEAEEQEQEAEEEYLVLKELPVQPIRKYKDPETGETKNLITVEESLTNIENHLRKMTGGL